MKIILGPPLEGYIGIYIENIQYIVIESNCPGYSKRDKLRL